MKSFKNKVVTVISIIASLISLSCSDIEFNGDIKKDLKNETEGSIIFHRFSGDDTNFVERSYKIGAPVRYSDLIWGATKDCEKIFSNMKPSGWLYNEEMSKFKNSSSNFNYKDNESVAVFSEKAVAEDPVLFIMPAGNLCFVAEEWTDLYYDCPVFIYLQAAVDSKEYIKSYRETVKIRSGTHIADNDLESLYNEVITNSSANGYNFESYVIDSIDYISDNDEDSYKVGYDCGNTFEIYLNYAESSTAVHCDSVTIRYFTYDESTNTYFRTSSVSGISISGNAGDDVIELLKEQFTNYSENYNYYVNSMTTGLSRSKLTTRFQPVIDINALPVRTSVWFRVDSQYATFSDGTTYYYKTGGVNNDNGISSKLPLIIKDGWNLKGWNKTWVDSDGVSRSEIVSPEIYNINSFKSYSADYEAVFVSDVEMPADTLRLYKIDGTETVFIGKYDSMLSVVSQIPSDSTDTYLLDLDYGTYEDYYVSYSGSANIIISGKADSESDSRTILKGNFSFLNSGKLILENIDFTTQSSTDIPFRFYGSGYVAAYNCNFTSQNSHAVFLSSRSWFYKCKIQSEDLVIYANSSNSIYPALTVALFEDCEIISTGNSSEKSIMEPYCNQKAPFGKGIVLLNCTINDYGYSLSNLYRCSSNLYSDYNSALINCRFTAGSVIWTVNAEFQTDTDYNYNVTADATNIFDMNHWGLKVDSTTASSGGLDLTYNKIAVISRQLVAQEYTYRADILNKRLSFLPQNGATAFYEWCEYSETIDTDSIIAERGWEN